MTALRPSVLVPLIAGLALWQGIVTGLDMPAFILPGPVRVGETLWHSRALLADHALVTLAEILLGLGLGAALGWATALGLAWSPAAARVMRPFLVFTK